MKNVIMFIIIGFIVYQYFTHIENGDYLQPIKQIQKDIRSFMQPAAQEEKETAPAPHQEKSEQYDQEHKPPSVQASNERFVSITFVRGGSIEGKVLRQTERNDYILALPGGTFTVMHNEIKDVQTLTNNEAAQLMQATAQKDSPPPSQNKPTPSAAGPVKWHHDIASALAEAKSSRRIVMVDFSTTWCGWCKKLDTDTLHNRTVQQILNNYYVCAKIDGDKRKDLVKKYRVSGYPHILFITHTGEVTFRVPGYVPPDEFINILNTVKSKK